MSNGNGRGKRWAASKIKVVPRRMPEQQHSNLSRKTKIIGTKAKGESLEIEIDYDDLEHGDVIGRGQFGTVRKMVHKPSGMVFAGKRIHDDILDQPNAELEVIRRISDHKCPFLIKLYGVLHAESYIWVLTELMDTSLDRFYAKSFSMGLALPEPFISKVAFSVLSALEVLRAHSIMHRDIKPPNILLNTSGEIKVCDFGISGIMCNSLNYTINGSQIYMAPEKIKPIVGEGYKIWSDIWSLGISLFEIANGVHPYIEVANKLNLYLLIKKIVDDPSPKLDSKKFSAEFCQFIEKCLNKEPANRSRCADLLKETFITKHQEKFIDLVMIQKVIKEVNKEPVEN